ncbi:MAG: hypothetical protein VYA77_12020 [Pseudomonadota bacterium]|nr:hypothetical protein [Pseudomonadota bacterium]
MALLSAGQPTVDAVLPALLRDLSGLARDVIIVLDDYHRLDNDTGSGAADDALSFLLEHLPAHVHWVITTREDPSLPLARMRVNGDLTELRADDLRLLQKKPLSFSARRWVLS